MKISTRGRYALRVMIDLAQNASEGYVPMKEVANRQGISLKYLERIMPSLSKNKLVEGVHGNKGGYRLMRDPKDYTVKEILQISEGDLAPVACLECGSDPCPRKDNCKTLPLWEDFQKKIYDYFNNITLQDLVEDKIRM
ncbi:MAG: RrF2 family transcriptional regulator [Floccifex porci]|uniref:RrF2 family transcriptional regulator n=1 Tax=Floccifex porci TaxID=2606629 RepID=A0A7X2N200_9FIRM|nr:RrF2 family transcriptional regulator [Floccifex porci]MCI7801989.1 RrF2 family transcriptional regulator [Erysipelotrichaceae bacterium]MDD7466429.1 RrF2 family transcriptional regulator [Floccifex porci]MDO4480091.1 RrF2 family transcriptional regulator [Erysipelotrichaceae bacterium]MDY4797630.1 RrF2 family transcriptional regulator [Floccifex porci]MSS01003.1 RrF2 family transcriptional regulator [Floccifex porci]